jgi:hypothetical protein
LDDGGVVEVNVRVMCGKVGEGGRAVVRSGSFFSHALRRGGQTRERQNHGGWEIYVPAFFLHFILFRSRDREKKEKNCGGVRARYSSSRQLPMAHEGERRAVYQVPTDP